MGIAWRVIVVGDGIPAKDVSGWVELTDQIELVERVFPIVGVDRSGGGKDGFANLVGGDIVGSVILEIDE